MILGGKIRILTDLVTDLVAVVILSCFFFLIAKNEWIRSVILTDMLFQQTCFTYTVLEKIRDFLKEKSSQVPLFAQENPLLKNPIGA